MGRSENKGDQETLDCCFRQLRDHFALGHQLLAWINSFALAILLSIESYLHVIGTEGILFRQLRRPNGSDQAVAYLPRAFLSPCAQDDTMKDRRVDMKLTFCHH